MNLAHYNMVFRVTLETQPYWTGEEKKLETERMAHMVFVHMGPSVSWFKIFGTKSNRKNDVKTNKTNLKMTWEKCNSSQTKAIASNNISTIKWKRWNKR